MVDFGAVEGTCRKRSERNSEISVLAQANERQPQVWVHTQSVVLKAQSPFKIKTPSKISVFGAVEGT